VTCETTELYRACRRDHMLRIPENRLAKLRGVIMWEDNVQLGDREGDGGRKFNGAGTRLKGPSRCGWWRWWLWTWL